MRYYKIIDGNRISSGGIKNREMLDAFKRHFPNMRLEISTKKEHDRLCDLESDLYDLVLKCEYRFNEDFQKDRKLFYKIRVGDHTSFLVLPNEHCVSVFKEKYPEATITPCTEEEYMDNYHFSEVLVEFFDKYYTDD